MTPAEALSTLGITLQDNQYLTPEMFDSAITGIKKKEGFQSPWRKNELNLAKECLMANYLTLNFTKAFEVLNMPFDGNTLPAQRAIVSARNKLALAFHPDKNTKSVAHPEQIKTINTAKDILDSTYDLLSPNPRSLEELESFLLEYHGNFTAATKQWSQQAKIATFAPGINSQDSAPGFIACLCTGMHILPLDAWQQLLAGLSTEQAFDQFLTPDCQAFVAVLSTALTMQLPQPTPAENIWALLKHLPEAMIITLASNSQASSVLKDVTKHALAQFLAPEFLSSLSTADQKKLRQILQNPTLTSPENLSTLLPKMLARDGVASIAHLADLPETLRWQVDPDLRASWRDMLKQYMRLEASVDPTRRSDLFAALDAANSLEEFKTALQNYYKALKSLGNNAPAAEKQHFKALLDKLDPSTHSNRSTLKRVDLLSAENLGSRKDDIQRTLTELMDAHATHNRTIEAKTAMRFHLQQLLASKTCFAGGFSGEQKVALVQFFTPLLDQDFAKAQRIITYLDNNNRNALVQVEGLPTLLKSEFDEYLAAIRAHASTSSDTASDTTSESSSRADTKTAVAPDPHRSAAPIASPSHAKLKKRTAVILPDSTLIPLYVKPPATEDAQRKYLVFDRTRKTMAYYQDGVAKEAKINNFMQVRAKIDFLLTQQAELEGKTDVAQVCSVHLEPKELNKLLVTAKIEELMSENTGPKAGL